MDIKEKLMGTGDKSMEEEEYPSDFKENKEAIAEVADEDIAAFIRKKKSQLDDKEKKKYSKQEPEEEEPIEQVPAVNPEETVQQDKQSTSTTLKEIYMTKELVEPTKQELFAYANSNYNIEMQTGIRVTKENVQKVSSILKYLADNDFLVIFRAEKVEPIFNERSKSV